MFVVSDSNRSFRCDARRLARALIFALISIAVSPAFAQVSGQELWTEIDVNASNTQQGVSNDAERWVNPDHFRPVALDLNALQPALSAAPLEDLARPGFADAPLETIPLPHPDGGYVLFEFIESPVMEPELAAKFPEIKTFSGKAADDPATTVRFDLTPRGFHAQIMGPKGSWYIDPLFRSRVDVHAVYHRHDLPSRGGPAACGFIPSAADAHGASGLAPPLAPPEGGDVLRTYRIAVATTGEYTQAVGGTKAAAMAVVATTMNRVNGIYESELSIRLMLVGNNDLIINTDPATDPFTDVDSIEAEIKSFLNTTIGNSNYDVGHLLRQDSGATLYYGGAFPGVVCTADKSGGSSTAVDPNTDAFWVGVVAHELGHQFDARHTFNGSNCEGFSNPFTGYEPGSGSTVMAYGGICGPDNVQSRADPYFHHESHSEITNFITTGAGTCSADTATGNTIPTVDAGTDYTIPFRTPFVLTAAGDSGDADSITYSWEQRDLGPPIALSDADNGSSPLFRVFKPTSSETRFFPRLVDLASGNLKDSEKIPQLARVMNFRVTVRDGRGGVNADDAAITVTDAAGPFAITAPNGGEELSGTSTITWNVASTDTAPVNAATVDIFLSTDGGRNFDMDNPLAQNVSNDGSHDVEINTISNIARIMVKASDNVFFDISDANLKTGSKPPQPVLLSPMGTINDSTPTYTWNASASATYYQLWVNDSQTDARITAWYSAAAAGCTDGTGQCSITPPEVLPDGAAKFWVRGWNVLGNGTWSFPGNFTVVTTGVPAPVSLIAPAGSINNDTPTYTWNASATATWYQLWVNDAQTNSKIVQWYSAAATDCPVGTGQCSITPDTPMAAGAATFWVRSNNASGNGQWSAAGSFTVAQNGPPETITLISPEQDVVINDRTPAFVWTASPTATWYQIFIGSNPVYNDFNVETQEMLSWFTAAQVGCENGVGQCVLESPVTLAENFAGFRVRAYNANGNGPWSEVNGFAISLGGPPAAPVLLEPPLVYNNLDDLLPTFVWWSVPTATWYRLWVDDAVANQKVLRWYRATEADCSPTRFELCTITPAVPIAVGEGAVWVQAYNASGNGPWSPRGDFDRLDPGDIVIPPMTIRDFK